MRAYFRYQTFGAKKKRVDASPGKTVVPTAQSAEADNCTMNRRSKKTGFAISLIAGAVCLITTFSFPDMKNKFEIQLSFYSW